MNPLTLTIIGALVRWIATIAGAGAVATSDTASAGGLGDVLKSLPADWQALLGALATIATLVWSWWQKRRAASVPVEERTIP